MCGSPGYDELSVHCHIEASSPYIGLKGSPTITDASISMYGLSSYIHMVMSDLMSDIIDV